MMDPLRVGWFLTWNFVCGLVGVLNLIQFAIHWIPFLSWEDNLIPRIFYKSTKVYLNWHRNWRFGRHAQLQALCGANASRSSAYLEYGWCWFGCPCQIRPQLSLGSTKHGRVHDGLWEDILPPKKWFNECPRFLDGFLVKKTGFRCWHFSSGEMLDWFCSRDPMITWSNKCVTWPQPTKGVH